MSKQTKFTIENVLNDQVSVNDLYKIDIRTLDWIADNSSQYFRKQQYRKADVLVEKVLEVDAEHMKALYLKGMHKLKSQNIEEAKPILSRLLELTRSGSVIKWERHKDCTSDLAAVLELYMYATKENGDCEEAHQCFQEIYTKYSEDRGMLIDEERDIKNISYCLERIDTILSLPQGSPAWTQVLMVDLRKLLWDDKAPNRKALLARCGFNILLPSIAGHENSEELPEGVKLEFSVPMGSQPLAAEPAILYTIEDWVKQPIVYFKKEHSLQNVIKLLANIDGAHAETKNRMEDNHSSKKSGNITLIDNDQVTYDLVYKICAFLVTWLAEYQELIEVFPILIKYRGKYKINYLTLGFVPDWCKESGEVQIKF